MSKKRKKGQQQYTPPRVRPLRLISADDERLRAVALYEIPDERWLALGKHLSVTAAKHNGYAVAAPQVGVSVRLVGLHPDSKLVGGAMAGRGVLNPEVVDRHGTILAVEGCLTFPNRWWNVDRAERVTVTGLDPLDGSPLVFDVIEPMLARMWQHELDHLDGLMLDDGRHEDITEFVNRRR